MSDEMLAGTETHSFPKPKEPAGFNDIETIMCTRCGTRLVFSCNTGLPLPNNIFELQPIMADCHMMLVMGAMES